MILDKLVESTKKRVDETYKSGRAEEYKTAASGYTKINFKDGKFYKAIAKPEMSFICEVKKASPSKGLIAENFDYISIAKEYEEAGADAISVLTEPEYFKGDIKYLGEITKTVNTPVLRKDFIIDETMIYEARVNNASAVLLICSILTDEKLKEYLNLAHNLGMAALVEAHDEEEVDRAADVGAGIIGVNNRNLKDFTVDFNNSIRLRNRVSENILFVSESGIKTPEDIKILSDNGVNAVLIGETFMRADKKKEMLMHLKSGLESS